MRYRVNALPVVVVFAGAAWPGSSFAAPTYAGPEQCGEVLKAWLTERADRHVRMDVADKCLTERRARLPSRSAGDRAAGPHRASAILTRCG